MPSECPQVATRAPMFGCSAIWVNRIRRGRVLVRSRRGALTSQMPRNAKKSGVGMSMGPCDKLRQRRWCVYRREACSAGGQYQKTCGTILRNAVVQRFRSTRIRPRGLLPFTWATSSAHWIGRRDDLWKKYSIIVTATNNTWPRNITSYLNVRLSGYDNRERPLAKWRSSTAIGWFPDLHSIRELPECAAAAALMLYEIIWATLHDHRRLKLWIICYLPLLEQLEIVEKISWNAVYLHFLLHEKTSDK